MQEMITKSIDVLGDAIMTHTTGNRWQGFF